MKIQGQDAASVQIIGQGPRKAEVIVTQPGPNGKPVSETRHLLAKDGYWRDRYGNKYR